MLYMSNSDLENIADCAKNVLVSRMVQDGLILGESKDILTILKRYQFKVSCNKASDPQTKDISTVFDVKVQCLIDPDFELDFLDENVLPFPPLKAVENTEEEDLTW